MKKIIQLIMATSLISATLGAIATADTAIQEPPGLVDNLFLETGAGAEHLPGDDPAGFAQLGANWAIPLTPPQGVALGLQLGSHLRWRGDDEEWNSTFGGFGRNLPSYGRQQAAAALFVDYQRTPNHADLWAVRPVIGTTISRRDAIGLEGNAALNNARGQQHVNSLTTFWTRGWSDRLGTEFGAGYELKRVDKTLFRARAAVSLTHSTDLWMGGDVNTIGIYAVGVGVTFHYGGTGRHPALHNIGGEGTALYTPFPTTDFPEINRRTSGKLSK